MAKLFFRYSAMNAGKSTSLLQIAYNYEEQGQQVALFTAAIDDRSGVGTIASRLGLKRQVDTFDSATDFWALMQDRSGRHFLARQRIPAPAMAVPFVEHDGCAGMA